MSTPVAPIIAGCVALLLATTPGAAHAAVLDWKHNRCYTSDKVRVDCEEMEDWLVCTRNSCKIVLPRPRPQGAPNVRD